MARPVELWGVRFDGVERLVRFDGVVCLASEGQDSRPTSAGAGRCLLGRVTRKYVDLPPARPVEVWGVRCDGVEWVVRFDGVVCSASEGKDSRPAADGAGRCFCWRVTRKYIDQPPARPVEK
jgi:hypothetical protein